MSGYVRELDRDAEDKRNGIETVQIDHYESGDLPTGSVACLKDGRLLITDEAFRILHAGHVAAKRLTVNPRDASTEVLSPCPFCKGVGRVESQPHGSISENPPHHEYEFYVICNSCACQGPWVKSRGGAIRMWNMRTP